MPAPILEPVKPNFTYVTVNSVKYAYSYRTCIGFQCDTSNQWTVCENIWSNTTGKHLNALDGGNKATRLPAEQFLAALEQVSEREL